MLKRHRMILASFVLMPPVGRKGRRAAEIIRTSPHAFSRSTRYKTYGSDRIVMASVVATDCRTLVKMGLLKEIMRVPHVFFREMRGHPRGGETTKYGSPVFEPTFAGYTQTLSFIDEGALPDDFVKESKRSRKKRNFQTPGILAEAVKFYEKV